MTVLDELVDGASGQEIAVSTLLRKVKVVAARLRTVPLERWVDHELVGYRDDDDLPDYRAPLATPVYGNFSGPFGSGATNAPIPSIGLPEKFRDGNLFHFAFRQPIAELERLAKGNDNLRAPWPADFVAYTNQLLETGQASLYPGMGLVQAWQAISPHHLGALIDTVRTRILDLALRLETISPGAGEPDATPPNPAQLDQIVMNVYGSNVAIGGTQVQQSISLPSMGNREHLFAILKESGLDESALSELSDALDADEAAAEPPGTGMGARVKAWAGELALRGASAAGTGAAGAAGGLALKALASYFGLHVS